MTLRSNRIFLEGMAHDGVVLKKAKRNQVSPQAILGSGDSGRDEVVGYFRR